MDGIEDIISSLGGDAMEGLEFNPDDYAVDAQVDIYPNGMGEGGEEMPKYSVDELKIDIEPMLYDLSIEDVSSLIQWMIQARYSMKNGGGSNMPSPDMMAMPEMGMPMEEPQYNGGGMEYML